MLLLAFLVNVPLTPILSKLPRAEGMQPPRAYAENVRLPGKPPAELKDLYGAWEIEYLAKDTEVMERVTDLAVDFILQFNEDGTYQLRYSGRWGNPPIKGKDAAGVDVDESGTFKLSRDVLILDPAEVTQVDVLKNKTTNSFPLSNEKHVWVVHWETKRIHVAGRCAPYMLDPMCKNWQIENVWFTLEGPRRRKLGR